MPIKQLHSHTDEELLAQYYASNDNDCVSVLLERYTLMLFGVCMKYLKNKPDASDAVQQVYLKTLTELPKTKISFFKSWIYMVAKNHCLSLLKQQKKTVYEENFDASLSFDDEAQLIEKLKTTDNTLTLMHESLNELSPEQAKCVTLFYLHKQSYALIENQTGFNYLQIKSFIQNGKRKLKILLQNKMSNKNNG